MTAPPGSAGLVASALVLGSVVARAVVLGRRRRVLRRVSPGDGPQASGSRAIAALLAQVPSAPPWAWRRLRRAGLGAAAADRTWRCGIVVSVVGVVGVATVGGVAPAVLAAFVLVLVVSLVALAVGDRSTNLVDRELPAVLATVAAGVRSGASLPVAVREGAARARGPLAEDLQVVVDELAAGERLVDVLDRWVRSRPTPGVRMTGAALALASETGGAGAQTVDGVASTLRDRLAVDRELAALSSQARASAVVIGLAPIGFVVLTGVSDPEVWDFFLRTPAGLACLAVGCVLDAVGAGWMTLVARGAR